jgi:diguanylate cyclase (GGDEF)-like protein/PAS domain S-box-containing protein
MNVVPLLNIILSLFLYSLAVYVLARARRRDAGITFFIFCFLEALIHFGEFQFYLAETEQAARFWMFTAGIFPLVMASFVHFTLNYTKFNKTYVKDIIVLGFYISGFVFSTLFFMIPVFRPTLLQTSHGWFQVQTFDPILLIYASWMIIGIAFITFRYVQCLRRAETAVVRLRYLSILIGVYIYFIPRILDHLVLPFFPIQFFPLSSISLFFILILMVFLVRRHDTTWVSLKTASNEIVSLMNEALVLSGNNWSVLLSNPALEQLTGYSDDELRGKSIFSLFGASDKLEKMLLQLSHEHSVPLKDYETMLLHKNGDVEPIALTVRQVRPLLKLSRGAIFLIRPLTTAKNSERRLNYMAIHDKLTGLMNRTAFNDALQKELYSQERNPELLTGLFLIDVDYFADLNSSYGQEVGDLLLVELSKRIQAVIRKTDLAFRVSGDEFAIILRGLVSDTDAGLVAEKLLNLNSSPTLVHDFSIRFTCSIGIDLISDPTVNSDTVLTRARKALEIAKQTRHSFRFSSNELFIRSVERIEVLGKLREAIEQNKLYTVYQPKIDSSSGEIIGAEALLRWKTESGEYISPDRFIPLAEETGLILPIGKRVLFEACRQAAEWISAGRDGFVISVNVSGKQLSEENILDNIQTVIETTGIRPANLELEITETMLMLDDDSAIQRLHTIRQTGIRVSIDDFGSGYSSFGQLVNLPVDTLKIDKYFIREMSRDLRVKNILASILSMAKGIGLSTIAEGIERKEDINILKDMGCDAFQGYLFSKPLMADQFESLLNDGNKIFPF